ncbi:MAG: type VI secretion system protein TssA [Pseudomonadota bacterium]
MSFVDIDALLVEVDAAAVCGPNLEYDPDFLALEQAILGKPEVQYGDTITPAVPPEWKVVKRLASELLARSRDLRLAMPLLRSLLALHGIGGMADGLRLIERLLEERWDSVHPQLDPDDGLDPMLRINSLATLADSGTVGKELKECAFLNLPGLGPLTLRALEMASGELATPEGQERVLLSSLEASVRDVDQEKITQAAAFLGAAYDSARNIEALLVRHVGSSQALNLDALTRNLRRGRDFITSQMSADTAADGAHETDADAAADAQGDGTPTAAGTGAPARAQAGISGDIASRADVIRMLDKICSYYQRNEPSSPVPLLLARAKRLVPKNFFEIMEDLAPEGMAQLTVISGPQVEASQEE